MTEGSTSKRLWSPATVIAATVAILLTATVALAVSRPGGVAAPSSEDVPIVRTSRPLDPVAVSPAPTESPKPKRQPKRTKPEKASPEPSESTPWNPRGTAPSSDDRPTRHARPTAPRAGAREDDDAGDDDDREVVTPPVREDDDSEDEHDERSSGESDDDSRDGHVDDANRDGSD